MDSGYFCTLSGTTTLYRVHWGIKSKQNSKTLFHISNIYLYLNFVYKSTKKSNSLKVHLTLSLIRRFDSEGRTNVGVSRAFICPTVYLPVILHNFRSEQRQSRHSLVRAMSVELSDWSLDLSVISDDNEFKLQAKWSITRWDLFLQMFRLLRIFVLFC